MADLRRFVDLFEKGANVMAARFQEALTPPPAAVAVLNGVRLLLERMPGNIREVLGRLSVSQIPYVILGLCDSRLDQPWLDARSRIELLKVQKDARQVVALLRKANHAGPRRHGRPAAPALSVATLARLEAASRARSADAPKGELPRMWRTLAAEERYPNWKQLRRAVTAYRRSK